uniref:Uncharacterized protein n=1 Tax=Zea mays TaxID=4577 RepID=C4J2P9_MAIZE|nr:unknown [Zea mays]
MRETDARLAGNADEAAGAHQDIARGSQARDCVAAGDRPEARGRQKPRRHDAGEKPARPRHAEGSRRAAGGAGGGGEEQEGDGGVRDSAQGGERGAAHDEAAAGARAARGGVGQAGRRPPAHVGETQGREAPRPVRRGGAAPGRSRRVLHRVAGQGGRVHGVHEVNGGRARRGAARERAAPGVAALLAGRGRQATGHPEAGGEGHQCGEGGAGGGKERERPAQERARRQGHRREVHEAGAGVPPDQRGRRAR